MRITLIFIGLGFLCGCFIGLKNFAILIFKNNIFAKIIFDFLLTLAIGYVFINSIDFYFYGEIRLYICAFFVFGAVLERKILGKLFAKLYFIIYNGGRKFIQKLKTTKYGKIIFK